MQSKIDDCHEGGRWGSLFWGSINVSGSSLLTELYIIKTNTAYEGKYTVINLSQQIYFSCYTRRGRRGHVLEGSRIQNKPFIVVGNKSPTSLKPSFHLVCRTEYANLISLYIYGCCTVPPIILWHIAFITGNFWSQGEETSGNKSSAHWSTEPDGHGHGHGYG